MPGKFMPMTPALHSYAVEHSGQDALLRDLEEETTALGGIAVMQMAPEQGSLMTLLARAAAARRALEVGTFTGYGAISIARGLGDGGYLLTCDVSEEWTAIASRYFGRAGLDGMIELRLGPAIETLRGLDAAEPFDLVFIDADKTGYPDYYEEALRLLRPGGMIAIDNVFRGGDVIDSEVDDEGAVAIRELNDRIAADPRIELSTMIGVADGITLALKR